MFLVLGAVTAVDPGGQVVALSDRQRSLLASLLARAGAVVSVDTLVDLVWPGDPPQDPVAALHNQVSRRRVTSVKSGSARRSHCAVDSGSRTVCEYPPLARVEERRDQREHFAGPPHHADVRGPGEHGQLRVRQELEHLHHVGQR